MKRFLKIWHRYAYLLMLFFLSVLLLDIRIIFFALICMIGPIFIAFIGLGRFWCKHLCPRGSLLEKIHANSQKPIPIFFKSLTLKLVVLFIIFYMFGLGIYRHFNDIQGLAVVYYNIIFFSTTVGIILGFLFHPRVWCIFCPMGSLAAFITYMKKKRIRQKNGNK